MAEIEREIKMLNIEPKKIMKKMKGLGVEPKWKYIQEIYTYDFPTIQKSLQNKIEEFKETGNKKGLIVLLKEIERYFTEDDKKEIQEILNNRDLLTYINDSKDLLELNNPNIKGMIYKNGTKLKKWIRLRQTGEETTITIKKIINNNEEYQMDNVQEVEIPVPNIKIGKELLENLGYYPTNHQRKMRIAYNYKNTEVVIDKWPKIEPYVEIEGKSKEEICSVIKDLGFKVEDMKVMNTETVYELSGINLYDFEDLDFDENEEKDVAELMKEYTEEKKHSVIAISGMPAAGKTTLSQELIAERSDLIYFDFGAFFRTIALI